MKTTHKRSARRNRVSGCGSLVRTFHDEFRDRLDEVAPGLKREAVVELVTRLPQLDILLADTNAALTTFLALPTELKTSKIRAGRTRIYSTTSPLESSGCSNLCLGRLQKRAPGKVLGVVIVRNYLIEHADKRKGVMEGSWRMGELRKSSN